MSEDIMDMFKRFVEEERADFNKFYEDNHTNYQHIIKWKSAVSTLLEEKDDKYHVVGKDDTFGFNEVMVNQLMLFAYKKGRRSVDQNSFDAGYHKAMTEVADKLDMTYED